MLLFSREEVGNTMHLLLRYYYNHYSYIVEEG